MKQSTRSLWLAPAALLAAFAFSVRAEAPAPASGDAGGGEAKEAPAVPVKPHVAEIMPMTSKNLLLDVAASKDHP